MSGHCPDCDPLLAVGYAVCRQCGRIGYPTDAAWLDERHILVTDPPICQHKRTARTEIVDVELITPSEVDPKLHTAGRRCAGTNAQGSACRGYAQPGSRYCGWHQSQDVEDQADVDGGLW